MSSRRKEYHVDRCAAKAAKFLLVCVSHINLDMRVKIPAVMMAKGYSDKESKNRTLQMQVRWNQDGNMICQLQVLQGCTEGVARRLLP